MENLLYDQICLSLAERYEKRLESMRDFIIDEVDKYLVRRSTEFLEAVLEGDAERIERIRREAHKLVDAALEYQRGEP